MKKSEVLARPNCDGLVRRILRPDGRLLPLHQYFSGACSGTVLHVVSDRVAHGLMGVLSNRAEGAERTKFVAFVQANRTSTGRTADNNERYDRAAHYLDSKWVVLRPNQRARTDSRLSFSSGFNAALVSAGLPALHEDIPLRWLRAMFGSTKRVGGQSSSLEDHTTLHPHKTDACATCNFFSADLLQAQQTLKRHLQQPDQGAMDRQSAIKGTQKLIHDLQAVASQYKRKALSALEYLRECVEGAAQRNEDLVELLDAVLSNDYLEAHSTGVPLTPLEEHFCGRASSAWHNLSSDYQKDEAVSTWNLSPQPGPTYFMSSVTHYMHIFCDESCGETTGPTRFSRNAVYTRSETVERAKSSDDTLSTLCDMLLGGLDVGTGDRPVYRSGYGLKGVSRDHSDGTTQVARL